MLFHEAEVTKSLSNLYKQRYTITSESNTRIINSNQLLEEKLEKLRQAASQKAGFVEGLNPELVELVPEPAISLEETKKQAEQLLEDAREQAEQLLEDAKEQAGAVTEEARAEGERQGYETGRQQAAEELEKEKQQLEEKRRQLEQEYSRLRDSLEPQIVDAVCDLLEKVFYIQFDQYQEILLHLVKHAILKIESTKEFQVRISERNYQYIEEHKSEVLNRVGQSIKLEVEADASMDDTQCVIETDSGFFDCSIDVELKNLIKAIRSLSM